MPVHSSSFENYALRCPFYDHGTCKRLVEVNDPVAAIVNNYEAVISQELKPFIDIFIP